jgi:DNA-binding CsgD family transcriptional regulator
VAPGSRRREGPVLVFPCECGRLFEITVAAPSVGREIGRTSRPPHTRPTSLSPLELEVLTHVATGCTDRETARELGVSLNRVRHAVQAAIAHLAARSRSEAVFRAVVCGVLTADPEGQTESVVG